MGNRAIDQKSELAFAAFAGMFAARKMIGYRLIQQCPSFVVTPLPQINSRKLSQ
jgi:hypothetical protein